MSSKSQVRQAIEEVLQQVQMLSGRPCPKITNTTNPFDDLEGFDSLSGIEATTLLEVKLGCPLADGSAFVSATGRKRALTVEEAVAQVVGMLLPTKAA